MDKGLPMLQFIERFKKNYDQLLTGNNHLEGQGYAFDNLVAVMQEGLPGTDWVPPLLLFYDKFKEDQLLVFLKLLDRKFSADLMLGEAPTTRIENMNTVLKAIEKASTASEVISHTDIFSYPANDLLKVLAAKIYGRRFAKYILLKLDYLLQDHLVVKVRLGGAISIEHILPQTPASTSVWVQDFSKEQRENYTNWLGNLVLIGRAKNSSLGRLDFSEKIKRYFSKTISISPNSQRTLHSRLKWTPVELIKNQEDVLAILQKHY
jgi:hypothetical protein